MKNIKTKILVTFILFVMALAAGVSLTIVDYSVAQEYSNTASDQFDDNTEAYHILKSQRTATKLKTVTTVFVMGIFVSLIIWIWIPKKLSKKAKKKAKKIYR